MVTRQQNYMSPERFRDMRKYLILFLMLVIPTIAYGAIASPDNTFVQNDVYSSDFHTRLNENFTELTQSVNNVETTQIPDDTLTEADMADEINPRIRTAEGASCQDFVYSGLLPATDSDLTSDISAGTGYPKGYRIVKNSATAHTYTASKWTYVDLDINGDFEYQEQTIGGSAPSVGSNSMRLARVSTDTSTINSVLDLRNTNCASGPFSAISDTSSGANLAQLFESGSPVKDGGANGWIQGCHVKWSAHDSFTVKSCSAFINGEYRFSSSDITVPSTADDPTQGTSGVDTSISSNTRYNVFLAADVENSSALSVTYSSSATPAGVTNYRKVGEIKTDASSLFTSRDVVRVNAVTSRELLHGWINFNGTGTIAIRDSANVSGITDNGGSGDYTVTWDVDFSDANYCPVVSIGSSGGTVDKLAQLRSVAAGSVQVQVYTSGVALSDIDTITLMATGGD